MTNEQLRILLQNIHGRLVRGVEQLSRELDDEITQEPESGLLMRDKSPMFNEPLAHRDLIYRLFDEIDFISEQAESLNSDEWVESAG